MLFGKRKLETAQQKCFKELLRFTKNLIDEMIRRTFQMRDIQHLNITEQEKNKRIDDIANTTVSELLLYQDKLKELTRDYQSKN